jgi:hypothetical protein
MAKAMCRSRENPIPSPAASWLCTLPSGHKGDHKAHASDRRLCAVWCRKRGFCAQCGRRWSASACGPTHAVIHARRMAAKLKKAKG